MKKKILTGFMAIIAAFGIGVWYYVFQYSKTHHRDVMSEYATIITASQIVRAFETNEASANSSYLNKAIELKGVILKRDKDQAGNTTLTLKSGDPLSNIICTLKSGLTLPKNDSVVVVKGICTGFLSDVVLNDAIVVNQK